MSKELFGQEFGAEFSIFQGKVWDFDRELDTGDFPYDPSLPSYCSIDFGYRMPAVIFSQTEWIGDVEHVRVFDSILHKENIKTEDLIKMIKKDKYTDLNLLMKVLKAWQKKQQVKVDKLDEDYEEPMEIDTD